MLLVCIDHLNHFANRIKTNQNSTAIKGMR